MTSLMALISLVLPFLIGVINKKVSDEDLNFLISLLVCTIFGVFLNFVEHNGIYVDMDMLGIFESMAQSVLVMTGLTNISYRVIWNNKAVGKYVPNAIAHENQSLLSGLDLK